jgi:uncharacterized membrane protein YeiH
MVNGIQATAITQSDSECPGGAGWDRAVSPTPVSSAAMITPAASWTSVTAAWARRTVPGVYWPTAISAVAAHSRSPGNQDEQPGDHEQHRPARRILHVQDLGGDDGHDQRANDGQQEHCETADPDLGEDSVQLIGDSDYLVTGEATRAALIHPLQVPLWIDLAAVVVGALAGAGVAARQQFDAVGALLLAVVMGLGGGIIRDLLLGLRPVAVTSRYYLPTVAAAALAGFLFTSLTRRFGTIFVVLDALSVGLFTIVGVEKALLYDLPYVSAIFISVAAAVGGGLLVDLIAGRPVEVVHRGPWNATAALAGASVYVASAALGAPTGGSVGLPRSLWWSRCAWPPCAGAYRPRCPPT